MRAIYERVSTTEEENEELSKQLTTDEKRRAVKDLLGEVYEEGVRVSTGGYGKEGYEQRQQRVREWVGRTQRLIEAAFDKGEARLFLSNAGITHENLSGLKIDSRQQFMFSNDTFWMRARLKRLDELIGRVDSLSIRPDFDPQDWTAS